MSIFAIGDLHLSFDDRINKPMDVFGDEWKDHAGRLEQNWRAQILPEDTVIIAGDVSWGLTFDEARADLDWVHSLPGHKVIFKGNHDLWWKSITRLNKLYEDMTFVQNGYYCAEGIAICGSRGWVCPESESFEDTDMRIYKRELLRLGFSLKSAVDDGREDIIGVLHYPPTAENLKESGFTELFAKYGAGIVVYGHLHGAGKYGRGIRGKLDGVKYELVSLDYLDCKPVKLR